jgi:hypothetical protein
MARRNDVAVKIDAGVVRMAKIVAAHKDISLAEYLSDTLRPIVEQELKDYSRRALGEGKGDTGPSRPKR